MRPLFERMAAIAMVMAALAISAVVLAARLKLAALVLGL